MDFPDKLISIVINNKYLLYLVNESNMIEILFDTGFICDGTLYTNIDHILYGHKTD